MPDNAKAIEDGLPQDEGLPSFKPEDSLVDDEELVNIYTDEDIAKRHSTLDKEIARLTKEVGRLKPFEQRAVDLTRLEEARELEEARKDPDKLADYERRQELRKRTAELDAKKQELTEWEAEHQALLDAGLRAKTYEVAQGIAKEFGIDADVLLAEKQRVPEEMKTPEQMALYAAKLALSKAKGSLIPKPDSGLGAGAGGTPTVEQLDRMTPDQYADYWKKRQRK